MRKSVSKSTAVKVLVTGACLTVASIIASLVLLFKIYDKAGCGVLNGNTCINGSLSSYSVATKIALVVFWAGIVMAIVGIILIVVANKKRKHQQ